MRELIIPLGSELPTTMDDDWKLMYDGWKKCGAHSREWLDKTKTCFLTVKHWNHEVSMMQVLKWFIP
jgi:hypothetical protein